MKLRDLTRTEENMQELASQEKREYVRAPLFADVELALVDKNEYEAVRRSGQQQPSCRFVSQTALSINEGGQGDADSTFHLNLINFLIHMDDKLNRVIDLLSKVSGLQVSALNDDKGDKDRFPAQGSEISGAGMRVVCDKAMEPGQILKASFTISRFPVIPLVLFGQVMRVIPVQEDDKQRYQVVLRFIDLDNEDREKVIAYTFQAQRDAIRKEKKGKESNNG